MIYRRLGQFPHGFDPETIGRMTPAQAAVLLDDDRKSRKRARDRDNPAASDRTGWTKIRTLDDLNAAIGIAPPTEKTA